MDSRHRCLFGLSIYTVKYNTFIGFYAVICTCTYMYVHVHVQYMYYCSITTTNTHSSIALYCCVFPPSASNTHDERSLLRMSVWDINIEMRSFCTLERAINTNYTCTCTMDNTLLVIVYSVHAVSAEMNQFVSHKVCM